MRAAAKIQHIQQERTIHSAAVTWGKAIKETNGGKQSFNSRCSAFILTLTILI